MNPMSAGNCSANHCLHVAPQLDCNGDNEQQSHDEPLQPPITKKQPHDDSFLARQRQAVITNSNQ
jgi:hypothetical protein